MKLMKDMNREELIELIAVVSLRVLAFDFALGAFRYLFHFSHYMSPDDATKTMPRLNSYTAKGYVMDIAYDTVMTVVLFILTVPLARLLCRGIASALEQKTPS